MMADCDLCKGQDSIYVLRKPFLLCRGCAEKIEEAGDWRDGIDNEVDVNDMELIGE